MGDLFSSSMPSGHMAPWRLVAVLVRRRFASAVFLCFFSRIRGFLALGALETLRQGVRFVSFGGYLGYSGVALRGGCVGYFW